MTAQSDETKIAVIGVNISNIQKDIAEIKQSQKDMLSLSATKADVTALSIRVEDVENKLSALQKFQYMVAGGLTVLAFIAPLVLQNLHLIK